MPVDWGTGKAGGGEGVGDPERSAASKASFVTVTLGNPRHELKAKVQVTCLGSFPEREREG